MQDRAAAFRDDPIQHTELSVDTKGTRFRDYVGDVEVFLVYCPETKGFYAVPAEEASLGEMYLRTDPPRNGQAQGIRWAKDYELPA